MDVKNIDWNEAWKKALSERGRRSKGEAFWNRRAPAFARHAIESPYSSDFIKILQPEPGWDVLDVGCGAGTLALPLAQVTRRITAIDIADGMLSLLRERCDKDGLSNIKTVKAGWEDDWTGAGIGVHDVVIASRSLIVEDLKAALDKLNSFASKRVYLSALVGDGPFDHRMYEAIGRELRPGPDYIYVYNLLHRMGILANIHFITNEIEKTYGSHEDALNSLSWMFEDMTEEEKHRLAHYLERNLMPHEKGWRMAEKRRVRWAVIWWAK